MAAEAPIDGMPLLMDTAPPPARSASPPAMVTFSPVPVVLDPPVILKAPHRSESVLPPVTSTAPPAPVSCTDVGFTRDYRLDYIVDTTQWSRLDGAYVDYVF